MNFKMMSSMVLDSLLATLVLASPAAQITGESHDKRHIQNGKAIYTITNDQENSVVAVAINADGILGEATLTPTGGNGLVYVGAGGKPDGLVSQGALVREGKHIFAVNPGSNTVSMLKISSSNPCALSLVGKPAALPGTFPNTVAASEKNSMVCVGTTGSQAGISCAHFDSQRGIGQMGALKEFALGQSDPPTGPPNTVSQTFFSDDEQQLFTLVKSDPTLNRTGFLSVYQVVNNGYGKAMLAAQDTRSSPMGTAVLFGSQVIEGTNSKKIFVTDASFGAGILTLDESGSAKLTAKTTIADQKATCWTIISPLSCTAFVSDVFQNRIIEMGLDDANILNTIDFTANAPSSNGPGVIDMAAAGAFVYALSPGNGTTDAAVNVVDVRSKQLVQHRSLKQYGVGPSAQGMAVLV